MNSDIPNNPFIQFNINTSPKTIYYNTIYALIKQNKHDISEIKAIALKFQKILSLEIEQFIIQRLLNGEYANHIHNKGGTYEIFPQTIKCHHCHQTFTNNSSTKNNNITVNINIFPTICKLWNSNRLINNLKKIGIINNHPFQANENHKATLFTPINLLVVHNGNHSANVALYEKSTELPVSLVCDISHLFKEIYFNPLDNTFRHKKCHQVMKPALFHENIGYIYEISKLLYENNIFVSLEDMV